MSLFDSASPHPEGFREIDVQTFAARRGQARVVDVREPAEFTGELGHIPGAELVPLATVEKAAAGWPRDQELALVCRSGGRSGKAAGLLTRLGFTRVVNLRGGMMAWQAAGLPSETAAPGTKKEIG
jgi:rhodanese-related sulfurtransferase